MIRSLLRRALAPLRRWALTRLRETHEVRGFRVVLDNTRPDIDSGAVLARLGEALDLIARHHPWRLAHLRRDIAQLWVARQPFRGAFYPAESTLLVELTFLARTDIGPATIAATIVHEGVHARIHARGLGPASRAPAREERICRRAELAFGRALPPEAGAPVVERAEASLALADEEVAPAIDPAEAMRRLQAVDRAALARWRNGTT